MDQIQTSNDIDINIDIAPNNDSWKLFLTGNEEFEMYIYSYVPQIKPNGCVKTKGRIL